MIRSLRGLEYALVHSVPEIGIFHIRKQFRHSANKTTPISLYYVLGGKIY